MFLNPAASIAFTGYPRAQLRQRDCYRQGMQNCNTLRIDPADGSAVIEYRIDREHVESRQVRNGRNRNWERLSPEQLTAHVLAETVLAYWLRRRMGLHQLIRACSPDSSTVESQGTLIAA
jgi:hypothetical protein